MVGKSSTANSLFKEPVAQVTSFQQDTACPQLIKRSAAGFEMSVIDTQGLLDSDAVSTSVRAPAKSLHAIRRCPLLPAKQLPAALLACAYILVAGMQPVLQSMRSHHDHAYSGL